MGAGPATGRMTTSRFAAFVVLYLLLAGCRHSPSAVKTMNVIFDHDGAIDDAIAMAILLRSPDVRVHAMTICPADSYLEPATRATQLLLDQLGGRDITIAQGHSEGSNPFPGTSTGKTALAC